MMANINVLTIKIILKKKDIIYWMYAITYIRDIISNLYPLIDRKHT